MKNYENLKIKTNEKIDNMRRKRVPIFSSLPIIPKKNSIAQDLAIINES
jgi:hypothetical protein